VTPELERAVKRYNQWFGSYKKSGERVKVQVWLTVNNGQLEFLTSKDSYKVKRVRANPRVVCYLGSKDGPSFPGTAEIVMGSDAERGKLAVRRCVFTDNENGMLVGNDPSTILEIEDSEFGDNGAGDGRSHNLYVGTIQRFIVQGSYFHHARVGHLLKTRARENFIYYNRLTDEPGGRASYELEFPVGGLAFVVRNLIEQGENTENPTIISFGAEGYRWSRNDLYLSHNTIVNDRVEGGVFIVARPGSAYVKILNNVLVGKGDLDLKTQADIGQNWKLDRSELVLPEGFDFRLKPDSQAAGAADDPGEAMGIPLRPTREYSYQVGTELLAKTSSLNPGAFQTRTRKSDPALP
jgi:hypothetical protein